MKPKFLVPLLIIPVIAFFSCQKEVGWSLNPRITNETDSVLISKLIELDTTLPAPFDSIYYTCFFYDQQKRVSVIIKLERNGLSFDTLSRTNLYYQNSDTLPYKGIYYEDNIMDNELFKYYDISGRVIKDSLVEYDIPSIITTHRYTYTSNRLRVDDILRIPSLGLIDSSFYYFDQTRVGNNILTQKDTINLSGGTGSGGIYVALLNYQYDNHINPLKKGWYFFPFYQLDEGVSENFSDNNFSETYSEYHDLLTPSVDIFHAKFYYKYNTIGMPAISWEKNIIDGSVSKYIYLYTK